tara:strand:+ start:1870 stop:3399 length:1530 start_codon:yes stop_codon:yes gene_type:complete
MAAARLEVVDLSCRYDKLFANKHVNLTVEAGSIHGLLGENGAGKSTLLKAIYGALLPSSGSLRIDGREVTIDSPRSAQSHGIAMVYQHFSLFHTMTVAENIALFLRCSTERAIQYFDDISNDLDVRFDANEGIKALDIGQQQQVEILRCLALSPKILLLDEPTSVLTRNEADELIFLLRGIADRGCSVIVTTHKLREVRALCSEATILRSGEVAGTCELATVSDESLGKMIMGERPNVTATTRRLDTKKRPIFTLENISTTPTEEEPVALDAISLTMETGRIIGIAGVSGNGQEVLSELILGNTAPVSGRITMNGEDVTNLSTKARIINGLQVIAADRINIGSVGEMTIEENLLMTQMHTFSRWPGLIDWRTLVDKCQDIMRDFHVGAIDSGSPISTLSGGNLQKVLFSRTIQGNVKIIVCTNPTWGIDVSTARLIQERLIELRNEGVAILLISTDIEELFFLADRITTMASGTLSEPIATQDISTDQLAALMTRSSNTSTDRSLGSII